MNITPIIAVPVLVEGIITYGKTIIEMIDNGEKRTAIIQGCAIILSVFLCFMFGWNLFSEVILYPVVGIVLTGIIASRGSNYVSDFIGKIGQKTVG